MKLFLLQNFLPNVLNSGSYFKKNHYVGSQEHEVVANYLIKELNKLGLETTVQQGYTLSDWEISCNQKIWARIGTNTEKAYYCFRIMIAHHTPTLKGERCRLWVATILESVRAFLYAKTPHKNDIIILFSDAEELGLNGAALL
jgi:acetylornithine deacetylase/succinyl-diaminopimelate desuccinylase-like protein